MTARMDGQRRMHCRNAVPRPRRPALGSLHPATCRSYCVAVACEDCAEPDNDASLGGVEVCDRCFDPSLKRFGPMLEASMGKPPPLAFDSTAPEEWLTGVSSAARLYRRLLDAIESGDDAVHEARRDDVATEHLATAMNELRSQATAITEHLVVASRLPFAKRQNGFRPLRSQVDEVERLVARIGLSAAHARGHKDIGEGLDGVASRLDALDQARREAEGELPEEARTRVRRSIEAMRNRRS